VAQWAHGSHSPRTSRMTFPLPHALWIAVDSLAQGSCSRDSSLDASVVRNLKVRRTTQAPEVLASSKTCPPFWGGDYSHVSKPSYPLETLHARARPRRFPRDTMCGATWGNGCSRFVQKICGRPRCAKNVHLYCRFGTFPYQSVTWYGCPEVANRAAH
jgi:hypothetical protein